MISKVPIFSLGNRWLYKSLDPHENLSKEYMKIFMFMCRYSEDESERWQLIYYIIMDYCVMYLNLSINRKDEAIDNDVGAVSV